MRYFYVLFIIIVAFAVGAWLLYSRVPASSPIVYEDELSQERINTAWNRALDFLVKDQSKKGRYDLLECSTVTPEECTPIISAGNTAGVFFTLQNYHDQRIEEIISKGIEFIMRDMQLTPDGEHGIWKIFAKDDLRFSRIPADIDDTVISSLVLIKRGLSFPDKLESLRKYRNREGLYYNWISDEWNVSEVRRHEFAGGSRSDFPKPDYFGVDCVVNSNMLIYLAAREEEVLPVCEYLNAVVEHTLWPQCSFYYRNPYIFFHSLLSARDYGASCLDPAVPRIQKALLDLQKSDGTWTSNNLSNVFATLALMQTGYRGEALDNAVKNVLKLQESDGGWGNALLFPDLYNPVFYGSRALVTATAVKTLFEYEKLRQ